MSPGCCVLGDVGPVVGVDVGVGLIGGVGVGSDVGVGLIIGSGVGGGVGGVIISIISWRWSRLWRLWLEVNI